MSAVISKKEEKINKILETMEDKSDLNEFKHLFKSMYPDEWIKIQKTYSKEERNDKKHKGHPMPHPEKYLENAYKVGLKKLIK